MPAGPTPEELHRIIREELKPYFPELAKCSSTPDLLDNETYRQIRTHAELVLETAEHGDFSSGEAEAKDEYRIVVWNLERGIHYGPQLEVLRNHDYLSKADVLLLTETDVGMARSDNRGIAQDLARELGMSYAFSPCYLNLAKGSGVEYDVEGENDLGLHGNAILSRYPIRNVRPVALKNGKDKMTGREKRLGRQTATVADIEFPGQTTTFVSVHLDANSSQGHRRDQMQDVLDGVAGERPAIIGGDWNTSTYNSSSAWPAIGGFWVRVFMGADNVIDNHYLHPYNLFEKQLFSLLEARGFEYKQSNVLGERTTSFDVEDLKTHKNLREWLPEWCFKFIRWALRNHDGKCPFKLDWFATRGVIPKAPVAFHEFREGRKPPLSDHDPIGVDIAFPSAH